jgi:hypothetical protein
MARQELTLLAFCSVLLLVALAEPAFANRLQTIGGGVSGTATDKGSLMKNAALGFGILFVAMGLLSVVPAFKGHSNLKTPEVTLMVSGALVLFGGLLMAVYFIF